mgnify:CR=1 FL=1
MRLHRWRSGLFGTALSILSTLFVTTSLPSSVWADFNNDPDDGGPPPPPPPPPPSEPPPPPVEPRVGFHSIDLATGNLVHLDETTPGEATVTVVGPTEVDWSSPRLAGGVAVLFAIDRVDGWEVLRRLDPGTGQVMSETLLQTVGGETPAHTGGFATSPQGLRVAWRSEGDRFDQLSELAPNGHIGRTIDLNVIANQPDARVLVHDDTRLIGASSIPQVHLSFWEASVAPGRWDLIDAWDGLWSIDGIQDLAMGESSVWGLDPDRLRIAKFHQDFVSLHAIRHLPLSTDLRGLAWVHDAEEGCSEDLDGDGIVGFQDLILLLGVFDSIDPEVDLDGDGTVGMGDTLRILSRWGSCRE